jgi:hypothetical protein
MNAKKKVRTTEDVLRDQQRQADAQRGNTAMVKKAANALTGDASNAWIEISAELDKFLGAPLCKFTKQGEYSISDIDDIPDGTRCIAHADQISLGWQRWADGKVVERRIGLVVDKFVPPLRDALGDTDEQQWELQDDGTRRDPWQFQMTVPITRLDAGGEAYNFTTGSKGGLACLSRLTRALWAQGARREGAWSADRGIEGRPLPTPHLWENFLPGDAYRGLDRRRR